MKNSFVLSVVNFCFLFYVTNVSAAIVSTSGALNQIASPSDVTLGALVSDTDIFIFEEAQEFTLTTDLRVSLGGNGLDGSGNEIITAGTTINSYFIHKDSITNSVILSGEVTFDVPVLGVIASVPGLDNTDPLLGLAGTNYPTSLNNRGTAITEAGDSITMVDNRFIVTSNTSTRPDQVRVLTGISAVPVPATVWLFGSGLLGLIGIAGRRTNKCKAIR